MFRVSGVGAVDGDDGVMGRSGNVDGGQGPGQTVTSRYHKGDVNSTWGAASESAAIRRASAEGIG